jgi:hypothetical protein
MSYGLKVWNTNQNLLINTEDQTNMQIRLTGTIGSPGAVSKDGDFTVWNRTSAGSSGLNVPYNSTNFSNNSGFSSLNYAKIRPVDEDTPPAAGTYGIQIFDAGGTNTITFSSGYTKSFTILSAFPPGTKTNNDTLYSGSLTNIYVGTGGLPIENGGTLYINQFQWTSSAVIFRNYFRYSGGGSEEDIPNQSTIWVVQLRN